MAVKLSKGQSINLTKPTGPVLTRVRMGLGWDARTIRQRTFFGGIREVEQSIDLDASAVMIAGCRIVDVVYFNQLASKDGSLLHTGDNRSGQGDGDDESILVSLDKVSPSVDSIYFVVNSYSGESFNEIENAFVRVVDSNARDEELARYELTGFGPFTAMVMAKISRQGQGWVFTAIGQAGQGTRLDQVQRLVQQLL